MKFNPKNTNNLLSAIIVKNNMLFSKFIYQYFLEKYFHSKFSCCQLEEKTLTEMTDYYSISRNFKDFKKFKNNIINEINNNYYGSHGINRSNDELVKYWKSKYNFNNLKSAASKFLYIIFADRPPYDSINKKALNDIYNEFKDYDYYIYKNKFEEVSDKIKEDLYDFQSIIDEIFIKNNVLFDASDIDHSIFKIKFTDLILQAYNSHRSIRTILKSRFNIRKA